jgi:eukaryotic-like serine/threonine-protein kinase
MICPRCHRRYEGEQLFCPHDGERLVAAVDIKRIRAKPTELHGTVYGGRYQVRGLLGKGAMAQVLLALDQATGGAVAVKVLETKHIADKRKVARFIQEAKAAAQVTHPNIVEMLDVGMAEGGTPYLVMELLFGESLGEWLRREKTMSPELGLPFVRHVAEALGAVHRAGIVHRDVKPDNVFLLGEKKEPHTAKLVDFGFAKLSQQGALTQAGVSVGTVEYMSPEQAVSDLVDARGDVYGLGVLMYRVFSGQLPFVSADATEMLARHVAEQAPPLVVPASAEGPLAVGIAAIVKKALRKRPENRYASMEALLGDLARLDRGEPLDARLPPVDADVYAPRQPFAAQAISFLQRRFGKDPPP